MKISGFTIARNISLFDYPALESINSILPICHEFVIAVGKSDDDTLEKIRSINNPKIKIIETVWDESKRVGGVVLAEETNKALAAISPESDWCFYLQADEAVHECYLDVIKKACEKYKDHKEVEGLLFNYLHFYGSYDYMATSRQWYQKEVRIVRNLKEVHSYKDAQGFRIGGRKLKVKPLDAFIYHYGWVKPPDKQQRKQEFFHKLWHDDEWMKENVGQKEEFDYSGIDKLERFKGSHPMVMQKRIASQNWKFDFDLSADKRSLKFRLLELAERISGREIGRYKNYTLI